MLNWSITNNNAPSDILYVLLLVLKTTPKKYTIEEIIHIPNPRPLWTSRPDDMYKKKHINIGVARNSHIQNLFIY